MGRSCYHHGPQSNRKHPISSINGPVVVSGRFLAASESVRWVRRCESRLYSPAPLPVRKPGVFRYAATVQLSTNLARLVFR